MHKHFVFRGDFSLEWFIRFCSCCNYRFVNGRAATYNKIVVMNLLKSSLVVSSSQIWFRVDFKIAIFFFYFSSIYLWDAAQEKNINTDARFAFKSSF